MTECQYEIYKANNTKIYQVWIEGSKFHKKLCDYERFDKSTFAKHWINEVIPYDSAIKADFIYATEDKLDQCKKKLIVAMKKEQLSVIKKAQKKLESLEKIERSM